MQSAFGVPRKMAFRLKLPGGMLKIKTYRELRANERDRRVPELKPGGVFRLERNLEVVKGRRDFENTRLKVAREIGKSGHTKRTFAGIGCGPIDAQPEQD